MLPDSSSAGCSTSPTRSSTARPSRRRDIVRYDGDDPYLVVAADKGTATFSDIANGSRREYGFWLGDAFASGGSTGYDHKAMGITARGAWESVKRHFRELGTDIESTRFHGRRHRRHVGRRLRQRHAPLAAHQAGRRLRSPRTCSSTRTPIRRELRGARAAVRSCRARRGPTTTRRLISQGGGVFPRTAKSIPLSAEARAVARHRAESAHAERSDPRAPARPRRPALERRYRHVREGEARDARRRRRPANDAIRVDAQELRCRVVGEGGNLGLHPASAASTMRSRAGRILMDAIDNSAGVDCSDHEVNIKILLDAIVAEGDLTGKQRNMFLAEMTDEVAELVLRDNYEQTQAISTSRRASRRRWPTFMRAIIRQLEQTGRLDRALEFLPDDDTLAERKAAGEGLTPPELAILLSYTKCRSYEELLASDLPDDPHLAGELDALLPDAAAPTVPTRLADTPFAARSSPPSVTNALVNRAGTTFVFRLGEETGAAGAEIARAFTSHARSSTSRACGRDIEALDGVSPRRRRSRCCSRRGPAGARDPVALCGTAPPAGRRDRDRALRRRGRRGSPRTRRRSCPPGHARRPGGGRGAVGAGVPHAARPPRRLPGSLLPCSISSRWPRRRV